MYYYICNVMNYYITYLFLNRESVLDIRSCVSIKWLINELTKDRNVETVSVNSTLNKKVIKDYEQLARMQENKEQVKEAVQKEARIHQPSQDYSSFSAKNSANFQHHVQNYLLITGERRGRALIICNNVQLTADSTKPDKTISSLRQETLQTALKVLGEHFRLQVS